MPDADPVPTSSHPADEGAADWGGMVAWLAWTIACTATLAIFALRVKISAQFPGPQEDQAFLAVQVVALIAASWLAPLLLADRHRLLFVITTAIPLLLIANVLRGLPWTAALPGITVTVGWLLALHWAARWRQLGPLLAIASVLGPLLWYLAQEFAPTPFHLTHPLAVVSPPLGAAATSLPEDTLLLALWPVFALGVARVVDFIVKRRRANRA